MHMVLHHKWATVPAGICVCLGLGASLSGASISEVQGGIARVILGATLALLGVAVGGLALTHRWLREACDRRDEQDRSIAQANNLRMELIAQLALAKGAERAAQREVEGTLQRGLRQLADERRMQEERLDQARSDGLAEVEDRAAALKAEGFKVGYDLASRKARVDVRRRSADSNLYVMPFPAASKEFDKQFAAGGTTENPRG